MTNPNQPFMSFNNSPRKYYRWFGVRTHARFGQSYEPRAEIKECYAFFPKKVDGKWIWLEDYFSLITIQSAFNFGGTTDLSFGEEMASKSILTFKAYLKKEGIIRNLYREGKKSDANWELFLKHAKLT